MKNLAPYTYNEESDNIYINYMSQIIKELPKYESLSLLLGESSAQASFYFKAISNPRLNSTLYNNKIGQRIKWNAEMYGVQQATLTNNIFTNDYLQVYSQIRFSLSQEDKLIEQELNKKTEDVILKLTPLWNEWVDSHKTQIQKLPPNNQLEGLIIMTGTLNTNWLNPEYRVILKNNPSYPYTHIDKFSIIYNRIPESVSEEMVHLMKESFMLQGEAGALIYLEAEANQTLRGIINNTLNPDAGITGNGAIPLTKDLGYIPGLEFKPENGSGLEDQLNKTPADPVLTYISNDAQSIGDMLKVNLSENNKVIIPSVDFFSFTDVKTTSSIFNENYSGERYNIEVVINNPTVSPPLIVTPLPYDIYTNKGWFDPKPIKEALSNISKSDVTGYTFNVVPLYDFGDKGNFGIIRRFVFSQFIRLKIEFYNCQPLDVKNYFLDNKRSKLNFLNIDFGQYTDNFEMHFINETESSIHVVLIPSPPGYTPPGPNIEDSLSGLVAVEVDYPFAE